MYECEEALELKVPGWLQSGRWTSRVFEVLWKSWELSLTHCMLNITASQIVKIVLTSGSLFSTALFHSWFLAISFGMIKSWLIYGVLLIDGCQTLLPWGTGAGFPNFWIPTGKFWKPSVWFPMEPLPATLMHILPSPAHFSPKPELERPRKPRHSPLSLCQIEASTRASDDWRGALRPGLSPRGVLESYVLNPTKQGTCFCSVPAVTFWI